MSTPRNSIIAGPARITFQGQTLFSQGDVIVSTRVRAFEVAASGRPAQRREDQVDMELTFTPGNAWPPMCALLGSLAGLAVGQDLFGDEGTPVVVDSTDGWTYTYVNGALTGPPPVTFSAGRALFGPATITTLGARDTVPTAPDRRLVMTPSVYPAGDDGYDPAALGSSPYTLTWGSDAAWTDRRVADGVTLVCELSLTPRNVDGAGRIGLRLAALVVTARARPLDVPDATVLAALHVQGAGAGRGRPLDGGDAPDLVIAGTGVYARLHAAGLNEGRSQFGATLNRVGDLQWTASVAASAADGPLRPLFFLGTSAPE